MGVALLTCEKFPKLWDDHQLVLESLMSRDVSFAIKIWNDSAVDWSTFDKIIVMSIWDYFQNEQTFREFIQKRDVREKLVNSADVIEWNMDKRYLRDLEAWGCRIIPTEVVLNPSTFKSPKIASEQYVVKPVVSANAIDTTVVTPKEVRECVHSHSTPLLVQSFRPEIFDGEISAIYFSGKLSHAVEKVPASGDFRVQHEYGGVVHPIGLSEKLRSEIEHVAGKLHAKFDLRYARIDGLFVDGQFEVMEVELIEPELFLRFDDMAADRYAAAIIS